MSAYSKLLIIQIAKENWIDAVSKMVEILKIENHYSVWHIIPYIFGLLLWGNKLYYSKLSIQKLI